MSIVFYCDACLVGTNNTACPQCGRTGLRAATLNDWCFLSRQETMWSAALKDYLTDNGIFFVTQPASRRLSAYGVITDDLEYFFVRAIDLDRARELLDAFQDADAYLDENGEQWQPDDEIII